MIWAPHANRPREVPDSIDVSRFATRVRRSVSTQRKKIHRESVDKSQLRAFRRAARELGADENEERFQETLRTVAKKKEKRSVPTKIK